MTVRLIYTCLVRPLVVISVSGVKLSSTLPHGVIVQMTIELHYTKGHTKQNWATGASELNLTAAENMCTRKAHSRTANERCLHASAGQEKTIRATLTKHTPTAHSLMVASHVGRNPGPANRENVTSRHPRCQRHGIPQHLENIDDIPEDR